MCKEITLHGLEMGCVCDLFSIANIMCVQFVTEPPPKVQVEQVVSQICGKPLHTV
jgi:hypothetical protein